MRSTDPVASRSPSPSSSSASSWYLIEEEPTLSTSTACVMSPILPLAGARRRTAVRACSRSEYRTGRMSRGDRENRRAQTACPETASKGPAHGDHEDGAAQPRRTQAHRSLLAGGELP